MPPKNIFDFVVSEEAAYQTTPVAILDNYEWSMPEHIKKTVSYKNSQFTKDNTDNKPFKNIIRPLLNLQYRTEGIDVKDITLFVNEAKNYYKSFLVKKYHDKWVRENDIDTFIDELIESYVDFGGVLVKDVNEIRPEVVPLQRIAFCDQTDILSGPIAEKHFYAPDQLKDMESKGWGKGNGATATIDELIILAENSKSQVKNTGRKTKTPSKYIEICEVHGVFPYYWLDENVPTNPETFDYTRQLHIIAFYTPKEGNKQGITLFRGKEKELPYKLLLRDKIYGRALGLGGAEELFQPQVWTNYDMIHIKNMLDAASKIILQTTDATYLNKNKVKGMENLEVTVTENGSRIEQVNTQPVNLVVFENSVKEWESHAQQMASATDALLGETPSSGTPFALQNLITQEGKGIHDYRRGKIAIFIGELYRDWFLPHFAKEIVSKRDFLADLDLSELTSVVDSIVTCQANYFIREKILNGEQVVDSDVEAYKQKVRESFMKDGKKLIQIFEGEMKSVPMDVDVNVAGKQKNLSQMTDKLVNIFRQIIAAPQVLDDPRMSKIFNQILEASGLDPIDFVGKPMMPQLNQIPNQLPTKVVQPIVA